MSRKKTTGYKRWMTQEEFELILAQLKPHELDYKLAFYFLYYMGLRRSEVCSLEWHNINGDLLRYFDCKTGVLHERIIPDIVKEQLQIYDFATRDFRESNYLFEPRRNNQHNNSHMQPSSLTWRFKKCRDQAGLLDFYYIKSNGQKLFRIATHTCRRTFITKIYNKTKDIILTQRIIGHKEVTTTMDYVNMQDLKEVERAVVNC